MKFKILLLLFISFLLCGCTATYTLNIDNNITDELNIYMSGSEYSEFNSDSSNYLIMQYANQAGGHDTNSGEKISGIDYYDLTKNDTTNTVTFSSQFDDDKINESALIKNVMGNYTVHITDDEFYLKTREGFMFPYNELESVRVIFNSPYEVLYSNAASQNGNMLIWNITKSNADNFFVEVNYNLDSANNQTENEENIDENSITNTDDVDDDSTNTNDEETSNADASEEDNDSSTSIVVIIIIVAVLIIAGIIAFVILQKKKEGLNKI